MVPPSQHTPPPRRHDRELARTVKESRAPAIARAAAVLRFLGRSETPVGVHAVARELGLVPSTCLHVLRALLAEELVAFDPDTKRYSPGPGLLTLARHWLRRSRFPNIVQPVLDRLGGSYGITVFGVSIVGHDHIIAVALSPAGPNLQISTQIGSRFPALISATGRCVAAFGGYPRDEIEQRFRTLQWDNPPSLEQWWQEVEETREQGYAIDDGNYIVGVTVVAAPVWEDGPKLSHALVAIGHKNMMPPHQLAALQQDLVREGRSLSNQLDGTPEWAFPGPAGRTAGGQPDPG